jgi:hypothetical protein
MKDASLLFFCANEKQYIHVYNMKLTSLLSRSNLHHYIVEREREPTQFLSCPIRSLANHKKYTNIADNY